MSGRGATGFWDMSSNEGKILSILGSIRWKADGSTDSLLLELPPFELVFRTRYPEPGVLLAGLWGVELLVLSPFSGFGDSVSLLGPQWHACFFGIAAVTLPQEHGREAG